MVFLPSDFQLTLVSGKHGDCWEREEEKEARVFVSSSFPAGLRLVDSRTLPVLLTSGLSFLPFHPRAASQFCAVGSLNIDWWPASLGLVR